MILRLALFRQTVPRRPASINLASRPDRRTATMWPRRFYGITRQQDLCSLPAGGGPPLKGKELEALHQQVPKWKVVNERQITRFKPPDFKQALDFVNRVGALAEAQGHHPDILLAWGKAEITLWD